MAFQFTLSCIKMGRQELAEKAISLAEKRLSADKWPEYYDTRSGRFIGKQSRVFQTWTIAGFLTSKMLLENPEKAALLWWEEDYELLEMCVCGLGKTGRKKCSRLAARSQIRPWNFIIWEVALTPLTHLFLFVFWFGSGWQIWGKPKEKDNTYLLEIHEPVWLGDDFDYNSAIALQYLLLTLLHFVPTKLYYHFYFS